MGFGNKNFWRATALLTGTMVGVGVFGIPFSFSKSGFLIGFVFLLAIAALTLLMDLLYGEVILRTEEKHQFVGYTNIYLGLFYKRLAFFSIVFTTYAALLAYIILAGDFMTNVLSSFFYLSPSAFSIWFFAAASVLILFGIKAVSWVELFMAGFFLLIIGSISAFGFYAIDINNYKFTNPEFWFFPYGVLLFAFAGLSGIPMQRRLLAGQEANLKKSIIFGVIFVSILYFIFAATILGISGDSTSPDAIDGLVGFLGERIIFMGSLFGWLAVSTSYLMLGSSLIEIFTLDYKIKRRWAWLMVVIPPFALFLGGLRNFIDVISLAGAVALGLESAILIRLYVKAKSNSTRIPEYSLNINRWLLYIVAAIFIIGAAYSLV